MPSGLSSSDESMMQRRPGIAVHKATPGLERAIRDGGGRIVYTSEAAGLVWATGSPQHLSETLDQNPNIRWVQLDAAGVDAFVAEGVFARPVTFTSAKGAYAFPVAEHALALTLALLRELPRRARANEWEAQGGTSLRGQCVLIVGGGGIAEALITMLEPLTRDVAILRRHTGAIRGARVIPLDELSRELSRARVVVLACALTAETRGIVGADFLSSMRSDAVLVNVARGAIIDTKALVEALRTSAIAGAALDVTEPEPLPSGHPLWSLPTALITPHSADTAEMIAPLFEERVRSNVSRFAHGLQLTAIVDPELGY